MSSKPYILAIDDDQFYLNELKLELEGNAKCKVFLGPNEFEDDATPEDIESADVILVDFDFGRGNAVQSSIANHIRNIMGFSGKLILWTVAPNFSEDDEKQITRDYDMIIRKSEFSWEKLSGVLETVS